jgi:hypothetical protein
MSGLGASVAGSSAAHAMLRNPAVADAAAIIVLNLKKPRREIPMMAPPDGQLLAEPTAERMRPAGVKVNRKLNTMRVGYFAQSSPLSLFRLTFTGVWEQTRSLRSTTPWFASLSIAGWGG